LASGFDQLYGVAVSARGAIAFAEQGTGRVLCIDAGNVDTLASNLKKPTGVAIGSDGTCFVSESAGGRIVSVAGGKATTVIDGLGQPQGILVRDQQLFIVDAGTKELIEFGLSSRSRRVIVADLPVGAPPGVTPKFIGPIGVFSGPMGPFAAIAAGADGTLYVSGDAEGSVLAIRPA
jgi:DNA-binding beta-propeller fold protein YncE